MGVYEPTYAGSPTNWRYVSWHQTALFVNTVLFFLCNMDIAMVDMAQLVR